ncbi:hypothetical protein Tco_0168217 [Tanacetum coccineum]
MPSLTVTYTSVYFDSEPWRFQWVSDDKLEAPEEALQFPEQAPPSPDYVPGHEHPPSPDYVPKPEYPEYLVPSDDEVPIEDQPLPADALPTALSPGYVADSDPEEDPEEDPADYPADGGVDDDNDDDNDEDEEEEHLALADSTTSPVIDLVPLARDTESAPTPTHTSLTYVEAPLGYRAAMIRSRAISPSPVPPPQTVVLFSQTSRRRARIFFQPHTPPSPSTEARIAEYAAAPTPPSPPPSPLLPWSSPLPHIPSLPLPLPLPPLPLPAPSSPLLLPATDRREDVPEADSSAAAARQPGLDVTHATDYGFIDTVDATLRRLMSREVSYGITDVWDDMVGDMEQRAPTTLESVNQRVTDFATTLARDTHEIDARLEDA